MPDRVSVVIVDSSGLIAEIDRGSELHEAARSLLEELRADSSVRLLVSPFVLAEVDYLVSSRLRRPDVALAVLRDVVRGAYRLEPFGAEDLNRATNTMERYADLGVGLTDAANVVLARNATTPSTCSPSTNVTSECYEARGIGPSACSRQIGRAGQDQKRRRRGSGA